MKMRNAILAGLMFGMAHGLAANAGEDKITKGYNSMDAMGCMLVQRVYQRCRGSINSLLTSVRYPDANTEEFTCEG